MYGTIMRAKVKPGRRAEYEKVMREMVPSAEAHGLSLPPEWERRSREGDVTSLSSQSSPSGVGS